MKTNQAKIKNPIKRFFKVNRINNSIDLSKSFSIYNNKACKKLFASEIYKVTFKTIKNSYSLFLNANELICNDCIKQLKKYLGIEISGDGSFFEVINYTRDFKIVFDNENSTFVSTNTVKDGVVYFL